VHPQPRRRLGAGARAGPADHAREGDRRSHRPTRRPSSSTATVGPGTTGRPT
jgi:hypothetical protein